MNNCVSPESFAIPFNVEFVCTKCGEKFTYLFDRTKDKKEKIKCPKCKGRSVSKELDALDSLNSSIQNKVVY